jgi:tail tube protein
MTETNRVQFAIVRESTFGTTPTTPRMRLARFSGEGLKYTPKFVKPTEIRSDRMNVDPVLTNFDNGGPVNGEFSYPEADTPASDFIRSLMWSDWVNTPTRDNDGTADFVITGIATAGTVATVLTAAAFVAGQLVKFSGFGVAGNNGVFKVTTGSATVPAFVGSGITDETVPPAAAKMKVVGFQGASGDITATATGLASTLLDFTTLGLAVGMWIKPDSTTAAMGFATAALNVPMRIAAIAANALTLDNRPAGWTADAGTSKTIKVYFGDYIKNGVTRTSLTVERGFMGQTVPNYILQKGMVAGQGEFGAATEQEITWNITLGGLTGSNSTVAQDASPDAATTNSIMSANVNVGRIGEGGAAIGTVNPVKSNKITVNNNLRMITAKGNVGSVDIRAGDFDVTVEADAYFGDGTFLNKLLAGTPTAYNEWAGINNQMVVWDVPRLTWEDGSPNASGKNADATTPLKGSASYESTFAAHLIINRIPYYA